MKQVLFIPLYFLFLLENGTGQVVEIEWEQNYGGTSSDVAYSAILTTNSNYVFAGKSSSFDEDVYINHGSYDFWVAMIDTIGNLLWEKTYGGSGGDYAESIYPCFDGGFIVAGTTYSIDGDITDNAGFGDCWILKIDSLGNLEWQTTIGGSETDFAVSIIQIPDSGYVFTGLSHSEDGDITEHFGSIDKTDLIVCKLDKFGNLVWNTAFGGGSDDFGTAISMAQDGNYLVTGSTNLYGYFDYWVLKLDAEGNLIWDKSYGGSDYDVAYAILETTNKNMLITGEASSDNGDVDFHHENQDMWTILVDSLGEIIWQNSLGGSSADLGFDLVECSDGSYLIAGQTTTLNDGDVTGHHGGMFIADVWIVKLDSNGVLKWQKCLGGDSGDGAYTLLRINDKKCIAFGSSSSSDGDVSDHYFGDFPGADVWVVQISETCDQVVYYTDLDNDLFGDTENYIYSCFDTIGYVLMDGDCDDTNEDIYPGAPEVLNGLDDDCNGIADDNVALSENGNGGFYFYPNPVEDVLLLQNNVGLSISFNIYSSSGQLLIKLEEMNTNSSVNVADFLPGLYLIVVQNEIGIIAREFIKE